ncbi:K-Cl cotransporter [Dictyocaulus viviparus]|uniref:K-Cl cotransporter n=1 Tax=Dictyocaulus viviparus TaxID=29172 RepID=A0A0D8XQH9_DICVI|nr:K-Cl cotransporter [Dictyocaulus viviparus]
MTTWKDSRFQVHSNYGFRLVVYVVFKTEPPDDTKQETPNIQKSGSEPHQCKDPIERKTSSTGRFLVMTDNSVGVTDRTAAVNRQESLEGGIARGIDTQSVEPVQKSKGVHFSVGDKDSSYDDRKRENTETNATINLKSWRNMKTIEHPPIMDFYRNSVDIVESGGAARPSMLQLIHGDKSIPEEIEIEGFKLHNDELVEGHMEKPSKARMEKFSPPPAQVSLSEIEFFFPSFVNFQTRVKFGWIQGVFVRCLLNIFGVMLYLRISWVAGQAGIGLGSMIVLLASLVTTITAISTCAICTNGDVKGGGAYFLISRSLGPEFGGSIGLIFSVANAVGAAMYIVGFAETVRDIFMEVGFQIIDADLWDVRLIGFAASLFLFAIVFIGTEFESRMQMGLLVILSASIVDYMIGSFFPPNDTMIVRGATGYSINTLLTNFLPAFRGGEDFFSVFAVYFPAATGIMAGANISGDLADPQRAIPTGTLLAIGVTTTVYLATVWMTGSTCVRDADGVSPPLWNKTTFIPPDCSLNETCRYGLMNYFQIMEMESLWGPLITAGIFAATLSSALASLVSAPKVFQAVCKDHLFPKIGYFAKGFGKNEEPRRAYILTFIIAAAMVGIGDLNAIAPIISNFFLASYALINYACFDASFADSPGFRPGFKYYNMWVSLAGALLCIIVMFIISWVTALITFFCFAALFLYILHRKPDVNWGSSTQAHSYKNALSGMIKLSNTEEHVKNYRPQLLVLCGNAASRPSLVDFANSITKGSSLMICGYVVPYNPSDRVYSVMRKMERQLSEWLRKRHIKAFYTSVANSSLRAGAQSLLQVTFPAMCFLTNFNLISYHIKVCGLGKLRPNILLIGFKTNWHHGGLALETLNELNEYFGTIQDAFDSNMAMCVLRNGNMGLDFSEAMKLLDIGESKQIDINLDVNAVDKVGFESHLHPSADSSDLKVCNSERKQYSDAEKAETDSLQHKDNACSMERFAKLNHHCIAGDLWCCKAVVVTYVTRHSVDFTLTFSASNTLTEDFGFDDIEDENCEYGEENHQKSNKNAMKDVSNDMELGLAQSQLNDESKRNSNTFSLRRRSMRRPTTEQKALIASISRFQRKIKKGVIDVWWLYDDGGLTLLIPHLLTIPKSYLEGAKMRIFTISTSSRTMEQEQRSMAALLSKFRINFSDVSVISDIGRNPRPETIVYYFSLMNWEKLIGPFVCADDYEKMPGTTSKNELESQKQKTYRQLRTSELLREHSMESDLVVITLPVPRKGMVSASLYLSWLDMMTRGLPPTLLVRGNQTSVLTFYS